MKRIAVIGTGYVGLVSGTCFAETGNQVICVDINEEKVESLRNGEIPIYEPLLDQVFKRNVEANRLGFTTDLYEAVKQSEIIFLALPTPPGEDGSADLSYVIDVAEKIGKIIDEFKIIVDKSTVPVGTADKVKIAIQKNAKSEFAVVSNPEFLREGYAIDDFLNPNRVVIGTSSNKAKKIMGELYKPFVKDSGAIIFMDERSAELTKYAANSFLATKITFMNEIANFCEKVGANIDMVKLGIGTDVRIGRKFLNSGVGYGGSCFPKDVNALIRSGKEVGYNFEIINSVTKVNDKQKLKLLDKAKKYFGDLKGKKIAVWGLSFKPNTDDIREASSIDNIKKLIEYEANIIAYDPKAMDSVKELFGNQIKFGKNQYEILNQADALFIFTEWNQFKNPDFNKIKQLLKTPVIFDGRNIFDLETMFRHGFYYESIGRIKIS